MIKTILTFPFLSILKEYVGPLALTVALIATGPLLVLFLGDKDFKRSTFMLIKSIVAMVLSLIGTYVMFTSAAVDDYDVFSRNLYAVTLLVSVFSTCGIIMLRAGFTREALSNDYQFLSFFVSYHFAWLTTSLKNSLPEKTTLRRTGKAFMSAFTRKELVFENKLDSTSDVPKKVHKKGEVLEPQHE